MVCYGGTLRSLFSCLGLFIPRSPDGGIIGQEPCAPLEADPHSIISWLPGWVRSCSESSIFPTATLEQRPHRESCLVMPVVRILAILPFNRDEHSRQPTTIGQPLGIDLTRPDTVHPSTHLFLCYSESHPESPRASAVSVIDARLRPSDRDFDFATVMQYQFI
jgi:hypothetical protein